jgi:hypothetical protein
MSAMATGDLNGDGELTFGWLALATGCRPSYDGDGGFTAAALVPTLRSPSSCSRRCRRRSGPDVIVQRAVLLGRGYDEEPDCPYVSYFRAPRRFARDEVVPRIWKHG